jgi:hypothetical protein
MTEANLADSLVEDEKPCGCWAAWPYFAPNDRLAQLYLCMGCHKDINIYTEEGKTVFQKMKEGKYIAVESSEFFKWAQENKITSLFHA